MRCRDDGVTITFVDGTTEEVRAYKVTFDDSVLSLRTSHDTAYRDDWESYPLSNIKKWSTK